ncbi:MAG: acyl-CoA dehydrogenase family protein, partial [Ignavibacteriaceae bacterium]|nr:acyl-CoA dehydrogenase family protein [Ignavibacteriaceae bacterium]
MADVTTKKVLLGGEFLIKDSDPQSVFIPEEINEEQKMMVETAGEFVKNEIWPKLDAIDHQEPGLTVSLLDKAGELGLLGISIPEEYGGLG